MVNKLNENIDEEELYEVDKEIKIAGIKYDINYQQNNEAAKQQLLEVSRIESLKASVRNNVLNRYKKLQLDDLTESYNSINKDIILKFNKIINTEKEIIEAKNKSKEELQEKLKKAKEEYRIKDKENKEMRKALKEIENSLGENIEEIFSTMDKMIRE